MAVLRSVGELMLETACRWKKGGVIVNGHTLSREQTRRQVTFLSRWFDFIHHDELFARLERPGRRPFCLLTFDDGKRSNATETAPELLRLGVPAVFYLTTRFVSEQGILWFDIYRAIEHKVGQLPVGLEPGVVKRLPHGVLLDRLTRACEAYAVVVDRTDDNVRAMSWDEARRLAADGFTIGAHSLWHAILPREMPAVARLDIEQSIGDVAAEIGRPCETFAFPNGNYTAALARHALACGVRSVMTTEPVWTDHTAAAWSMPRVQLFGTQRDEDVARKLAVAAMRGILKNPDGTGTVYQHIHKRALAVRATAQG